MPASQTSTSPAGKPSRNRPGTRTTRSLQNPRESALSTPTTRPIVELHKVQRVLQRLRPDYPGLDDDTAALVVLHVQTGAPIARVARSLGADKSWAYARLARPDVQKLVAELAIATLGVAAIRGVQTLEKLTQSASEEMAFKASVELADRAGLGNTSVARSAGTSGFSFTFAAKPEEPQR